MIDYLLYCSGFSVLVLLMLRYAHFHFGLQSVFCATAIGLWCIPWPYLSTLSWVGAVELFPVSQMASINLGALQQATVISTVNFNDMLQWSMLLLLSCGGALHLGRLYHHRRYCRQIMASAVVDPTLQKRFGGHIMLTDKLSSPVLVGVFHPVILLPKQYAGGEEGQLMLAHELHHRRHYDHLKVALLGLLQSLFFWNPLLQKLIDRQRNLIELGCDVAVAQKHPGSYRQMLGQLALRQQGFDLRCSMAMGNVIWRLKVMEMTMKNQTNRWKNIAFCLLMLGGLVIAVPSLLGSPKVLAAEEDRGALLTLNTSTRRSAAGEDSVSRMQSELWLHYDYEFKMAMGEDFELRLTLLKKSDDTVFLAAKLLDLNADKIVSEPQLLVPFGKEATIEVGDEAWRYQATFKVSEQAKP